LEGDVSEAEKGEGEVKDTNQIPSCGFASVAQLVVGSKDEEDFGRHCGVVYREFGF
jgi:hypothetical protein